MLHLLKPRLLVSLLLLTCLALPALADDVTVSGTVTFAQLDGSALDHDGLANGVFTVSDGNLTISGSVTCNDTGSGSSSACPMKFFTSGNFTMLPGSSLYAENRTGGGNGGDITVTAGGNVTLQGPSGALAGAIISTNRGVPGGPPNHAGSITVTAGGTTSLQAGTIVTAGAGDGNAGAINITAQGVMTISGLVAAGPTSTVASTKYTGEIFTGGVTGMGGGSIRIASSSHTQPAVVVGSDAIVATQGANGGTGSVTLEGCDVRVNGLVGSLSRDGSGAHVIVRSGTSITVDGRDVNRTVGSLGRNGMIRAESTFNGTSGAMMADLFAANDITIYGPDPTVTSVYGVGVNGKDSANDISGVIRVISTGGAVTASGNAFSAAGSLGGDVGGSINVSAKGNVTLNNANVKANGDFTSTDASRAGGHINVRSYSGAVSWQNGSGDVRPVGSSAGVPASQQGTISLTYCTTVSTSGSTFPANGSPVGVFPTTAQTCSPAAPTLPAGEPALPTCNRPPVATGDAYTVAEGGTLNVAAPGVLGNDSDPDGDPITAVLVSGPAHASSFTLNADGSFTYVHDGSETTSDSFTYKANDGSLDSNTVTVAITITPVNDAPVANDDTATVAEGGTLNVAAPGVLSNDTDPDSSITAVLVSGPAHASSFTLNPDGSYIYVHDGSETTSDSFTYKASDGSLFSNVATVTITITPVNDAPVANNDTATVAEGGTLNVAAPGVLGNDTDVDSPSLTAVLVSGPAHATSFTFNADGSYTYVHDGSETTSDSFTYKASDGSLFSNVATVSITVTPVDDAPVAVADSASVDEGGTLTVPAPGVLGNDTDVDSPTLTAVLVTGPAHASSFALNPNGSYTYVHDGSETTSDSFTYKANDGTLDSNTVTVTITINPINDAPTAVNDAYSVDEAGTLNVAAPGVLGNDTDPDSPSLTASLVSGPAHAASFSLNADGSFTYVHDGTNTTFDSFTYKASDGSALSNIATVSITINPVNDAPVLANGSTLNYTENGAAAIINGAITVSDADSPNLVGATVAITGGFASGQDVLIYTPVAGISGSYNASTGVLTLSGSAPVASYQTALRNVKYSNGSDDPSTATRTVSFQVNDGEPVSNLSNVVTSTINVTAVNDAPVAFSYAGLPAQAGIPISYPAGKLGGTDAEAGTTITVDTTPINVTNIASIFLNGDGSFTVTPFPSAAGSTASFMYRVSDDGNPAPGVSSSYVTVTFNVAGPAIYFTKSVSMGLGDCTLGNECTVATALSQIGSATNRAIFIGDANTQSPGSISLNSGGSIVGQGVTAASFDAVFGIVPPSQGVLAARPAVNQPRPQLNSNITLNNNSAVRGFNINVTANDALASAMRNGVTVTDLSITSSASSPASAVDFAVTNGTFNFDDVTVTGSGGGVYFNTSTSASTASFGDVTTTTGTAVTVLSSGSTDFTFHAISANGAGTGISVQNASGSFMVTGTGTTAGSGGTIQNCTAKGADIRNASDVTLKNMSFSGNGTANLAAATVCGDVVSGGNNGPANCNANLSFSNSSNVVLNNVSATGSKQIGIDVKTVSNLTLTGVTVTGNGDEIGEDGVQLFDVTGTLSVTGGVYRDNASNQFETGMTGGTLNATVSGASFSLTNFPTTPGGVAPSPGNATANSGLIFHANSGSSATMNATVTGCTFSRIYSHALRWDAAGTSSGTVLFGQSGAGNTFTNNGLGIGINNSGSGNTTYEIRDNVLTNDTAITSTFSSTAISASFGGSGTRTGTVDNNRVGVNGGATASGCFVGGCNGVELTDSAATGSHFITVTNNQAYHVNGSGVVITSSGNSTDTMRAKVQNNTIAQPDGTAAPGISVRDGNGLAAGVSLTCLDINGNTISGLWASATTHKSAIRLQAQHALVFALTNFSPSTEYPAGAVASTCTTQCTNTVGLDGNAADFISQQNPATISAQTAAGGSSASQTRVASSAAWTGTTGACP